jgi:hypothetical protein
MNKQIYALGLAALCACAIAQAGKGRTRPRTYKRFPQGTIKPNDVADMPPLEDIGIPTYVSKPEAQSYKITQFTRTAAVKNAGITMAHASEAPHEKKRNKGIEAVIAGLFGSKQTEAVVMNALIEGAIKSRPGFPLTKTPQEEYYKQEFCKDGSDFYYVQVPLDQATHVIKSLPGKIPKLGKLVK